MEENGPASDIGFCFKIREDVDVENGEEEDEKQIVSRICCIQSGKGDSSGEVQV